MVTGNTSVINRMRPELREHFRRIRKLYNAWTTRDLVARYDLAASVRLVKQEPRKYGKRAIAQVAEALGCSDKVLYKDIQVVEKWPTRRKFVKLTQRRDKIYGRPISWSHLEELAPVSSAKGRGKLLELVFAEGLSVRELRSRMRPKQGGKRKKDLLPRLRRVKSDFDRIPVQVKNTTASLFELLDRTEGEILTPAQRRELLTHVRDSLEQTRSTCEADLEAVEQALRKASLKKAQ